MFTYISVAIYLKIFEMAQIKDQVNVNRPPSFVKEILWKDVYYILE